MSPFPEDDAAGLPPRFCPSCKQDRRPGDRLCPRCGGPVALQGYCSICEGYWRLEPGKPCPKHELPLEAESPLPLTELQAVTAWVTVASFGKPVEAEARRLRLEAEGIPTFLDGARMGANSLYEVATGGIKLQVPRDLVAEARVLLAQTWSSPFKDDLDDAWEDLAPEPGAAMVEGLAAVVLAVILGIALILVLLVAFSMATG